MSLFLSVVLASFCLAFGDVTGPITSDFQTWLNANGYQQYNFARTDLGAYGSFGGKTGSGKPKLHNSNANEPVIFIHGNSDQALRNPSCSNFMYCKYQTGWTNSIQYFLSQGYTSADLYATTWGDANGMNAQQRTHNCAYVMQVRKFIDAVIAYTGASKVDIVTHSMGVTLARKAIQGGSMSDEKGITCNIGSPLTDRVDTFVGISGGNYGLCNCQYASMFMPTCNSKTGYYPGTCGFSYFCGFVYGPCTQSNYSGFLTSLNSNSAGYEGAYRYAFYSTSDEILSYQGNAWGQPTARFPGMTGKKVYSQYTHMQTKENTATDQYQAISGHNI